MQQTKTSKKDSEKVTQSINFDRDSDYQELEHLLDRIQKDGNTPTKAKTILVVLQAMEDLAKLKKSLIQAKMKTQRDLARLEKIGIHARMETQIVAIEMSCAEDTRKDEVVFVPTVNKVKNKTSSPALRNVGNSPIVQKNVSWVFQVMEDLVKLNESLVNDKMKIQQDLAKLEKSLVQIRMDTQTATVIASLADNSRHIESANVSTLNRAESETTQPESSEKNVIISNEVKLLENLPTLKDTKYLIPFAARVATLTRALCDLDLSKEQDKELANKVFLKFVDILDTAWIVYVRKIKVDPETVKLTVLMDFLNEEALKIANTMPISDGTSDLYADLDGTKQTGGNTAALPDQQIADEHSKKGLSRKRKIL